LVSTSRFRTVLNRLSLACWLPELFSNWALNLFFLGHRPPLTRSVFFVQLDLMVVDFFSWLLSCATRDTRANCVLSSAI
jgi:hypothetical protein